MLEVANMNIFAYEPLNFELTYIDKFGVCSEWVVYAEMVTNSESTNNTYWQYVTSKLVV